MNITVLYTQAKGRICCAQAYVCQTKRIYIALLGLCVFAASAFAAYPASFASTFSLAEHSACKEVVLQLKDGASVSALENRLHALTQDIFPYQTEVTNGYQHGFFLEALRGYAAMQNDNPPVAFRHFNNALLYYDEDAVFGHTEPLAEIYSAIGETCVAVGRYMDAKDWLDTAFLEAGDNTRIQANVLRASIRLGHAIGDYPDIILSYQYLQSIDTLDRDEIADYAQVLFWLRKDREGFGQLLRGIATHGIDNDLGVRDPLVHSLLNNIMRADDSEVRWFYDLLGWSITDARAKAGDEEYLAFLLSARTMLNRVFEFLEEEDDLEKVRERIDMVKEQLAAGYDVFGESVTRKQPIARERSRRAQPPDTEVLSASGAVVVHPVTYIEDLLMSADWMANNGHTHTALVCYAAALQQATGVLASVSFDGTTFHDAAYMGHFLCRMKNDSELYEYPLPLSPTSIRGNVLGIYLYARMTNELSAAQYSEYFYDPVSVLMSHPVYQDYHVLHTLLRRLGAEARLDELVSLCERLTQASSAFFTLFGGRWCAALLAQGDIEKVIEIALLKDQYDPSLSVRKGRYLGWVVRHEYISTAFDLYKKKCLVHAIRTPVYAELIDLFWRISLCPEQYMSDYLQLFDDSAIDDALPLLGRVTGLLQNNYMSMSWIEADIYLRHNEYQNAFDSIHRSIQSRQSAISSSLNNPHIESVLLPHEVRILRASKDHLSDEQKAVFSDHYAHRIDQ